MPANERTVGPLNGFRVLALESHWAGPHAMKLLAGMGAQVITVEPPHFLIGTRTSFPFPDNDPGDEFWNRAARYHELHRNRVGITIDLRNPRGVEVFKRLAKISDVVLENFPPRVMKNLGIDYGVLRKINPGIILLSSSGYGQTGPWRNYGAFGMGLEPSTGLSHLTGYSDGPPIRCALPYTDAPSAFHNAVAILVALHYRRRTGKGQWIDLAQYEVGVSLMASALMDYSMNQRVQSRIGNRDPFMAPHGCYPCRGDDKWVVLAVGTDRQWQAFCETVAHPEWQDDPRFADPLERWRHQDILDGLIAQWTRERDNYEVMHLLQAQGIPSAPVLTNKDVLLDPHLRDRGFFEDVTYPERQHVGTRQYPGLPWKMSKTPGNLKEPAPTLGRDNQKVLAELLGMTPEEITALRQEEVIGERLLGKLERKPQPLPLDEYKRQGRFQDYDLNFMEVLGH